MRSVGLEAGQDVIEAIQMAAIELAKGGSVADVVNRALELGLRLTGSSLAFLAVVEEGSDDARLFSRTSNGEPTIADEEIERLLAGHKARAGAFSPVRSTWTVPLEAGGSQLGVLGVASRSGQNATQRRLLEVLGHEVAAAITIAQLSERRQHMVDTLINLRADLDRSERQRLINDEQARSAERVEQAHGSAVEALLAVSRHARSGHALNDFYRQLTGSIAELVGARRVILWQLDGGGMLVPIAGSFGVDGDFLVRLRPVPCTTEGDDLFSRVVFHDVVFRAVRGDESGSFIDELDRLGVDNAISVPWRAGDERLGLVAAYDSGRGSGFSREDTWVLHKAALAAGLVWQLKYADTDLKKTIERLERVDAARQLLLRNVSDAVERARKRIAGDLHDDALQKLTAAELHLQRLHDPSVDAAEVLTAAQILLTQTEEALRRLLFEVRPPALEAPGGFGETIQERIRMLESLTGAEVEVDFELPDDLPRDLRSLLFRQLTEALANVEKHASARKVGVSLRAADGGVHGVVEDDGVGFVVAERDRLPGHLGLLALNERALLAGGWNKTESEPGRGTRVEFWFPLSEST